MTILALVFLLIYRETRGQQTATLVNVRSEPPNQVQVQAQQQVEDTPGSRPSSRLLGRLDDVQTQYGSRPMPSVAEVPPRKSQLEMKLSTVSDNLRLPPQRFIGRRVRSFTCDRLPESRGSRLDLLQPRLNGPGTPALSIASIVAAKKFSKVRTRSTSHL